MKDWRRTLIPPATSIHETMRIIEEGALQIALVVDEQRQLQGVVTDGDIRRGILNGIPLNEPVTLVMNANPVTASLQDGRENILAAMKMKAVHHIPVVNEERVVISVATMEDLIRSQEKENWVVLMAGGLGQRLRPLTVECPKPLLKVGSKPVMESIIESLVEYGYRKFYMAVNYKAEMIQDHFGDGSHLGLEIRYINEKQRMGTAGALGLLTDRPDKPFIVMNGDLLTKVNFDNLIDFHIEQNAMATMCIREYDFQVPYGVVQVEGERLVSLEEKPVHRFNVSAGIYVFDPEVLDLVNSKTCYDMPELFKKILKLQWNTTVFPIRDYWVDIGHVADLERANGEYDHYFRK